MRPAVGIVPVWFLMSITGTGVDSVAMGSSAEAPVIRVMVSLSVSVTVASLVSTVGLLLLRTIARS